MFEWRNRKVQLIAILAATIFALALIDRVSLLIAPCGYGGGGYNEQENPNDDNCAIRQGIVIAGFQWLHEEPPEIWTALATLAIAAFTATLWWSTRGLLRATNRTIAIASDDLEFTHRARVSIFDASIQRQFVMEEGGKRRDFLRISYTLKNSGNFPATRISESFADTCGPEWAPPTRENIKIAPQMEQFGLIIAPQEALVRRREIPDKTSDLYKRAESGKETFYLRVGIIVVYIDGFGKDRTTWKWFEWTQEKDPRLGWYFRECAARQD